jgi:hypothetical protein
MGIGQGPNGQWVGYFGVNQSYLALIRRAAPKGKNKGGRGGKLQRRGRQSGGRQRRR